MKFTEFDLHQDLLKGLEQAGYVDCTPVQEQVLKTVLSGADAYVQSQTGTGKTAAFLVAVIQQLLTKAEAAGKKALVMAPTRELAVQIEQEAKVLTSGTQLVCASFYGGVGYTDQTETLKHRVDIISGTPGRVIDLQESGTLDLSNVAFLVIDEADRMFDMGFYPDLRKLIKTLPERGSRQTMLFSATLNTYVKNLAWEYTTNPAEITIEAETVTVAEIDQTLYHVSSGDKMRLLLGILSREKPESVLIFCNTKRGSEIVSKRLRLNGIESEFIIGDLPQTKRLEVLNSFKGGSISCLVATDVAARGIDVNDLAMVVNYDLPNESENYVHRVGRTARAGKTGKAYTFCSEQDVYNLVPIERYIGAQIPSSMADESLFIEDKSKNVYIKLDTYGLRDDDNRPRRDERRRSGYDGERPEHGQRLSFGTRQNPAERREQPDRRDAKVDSAPRAFESVRSRQSGSRFTEKEYDDLAKMPFEERMKIYRNKYGKRSGTAETVRKDAGQSGGESRKQQDGSRTEPQKQQSEPRAEARKSAEGGNAGRQPSSRGGGQRTRRTPDTRNRQPPVQRQNIPAQEHAEPLAKSAPKKSGLLAKLKTLFGKKP
ncbi:DEAD/DEAH box helicase [Treponema endosymbiont of Eucomonympha sp.]|uniref:DEAD/DEAH box helicase n=1 Tax=Treponema endosymbiont of Eucomonympha sp. TaxID=1580831 RepID=UPI0007510F58|nr:DEAD/DEAH box helicase [Treponema endosymbiont of Eucomonympha sp.]